MRTIVLKYGVLAGVVLVGVLAGMLALVNNGQMDRAELVGYSSMVVAYLLVFFGIRSYRDSEGGGSITFGKAFKVGILITLVASAMYVAAWEVYFFNFDHGFTEKYTAAVIEKLRESGASAEAIGAEEERMAAFAKMYQNPFVNSGMTFLEVFPVGLVMTLVSAAILRRRPNAVPGTRTAAATI
jgi:hypothetical protein